MINIGGNSLYIDIGNVLFLVRFIGDVLLIESKVGVVDVKGIGGEDFVVINIIMFLKDFGVNMFD